MFNNHKESYLLCLIFRGQTGGTLHAAAVWRIIILYLSLFSVYGDISVEKERAVALIHDEVVIGDDRVLDELVSTVEVEPNRRFVVVHYMEVKDLASGPLLI